ncbi:hypothetical protein [Helicovermis profundi]|uniref:NADH dehydrogenase subunit 4L n=1 Tax=Helicovermis profundi TaxID=3065157 RepID=A0AAU9ESY5_9FIRM|nr:hypothetical protein HLPR_04910 [Clostridia bacterium S502]
MTKKEKLFPSLMILGACVLLFRTVKLLIFEKGLIILSMWLNMLTIIEMIIDMACILFLFDG